LGRFFGNFDPLFLGHLLADFKLTHYRNIGPSLSSSRRETTKMRCKEIKQVVKNRYGGFAEMGGSKEAC
jgi:hypothetical protein